MNVQKITDPCVIIPARIDSTRFQKKVLWRFMGIPMIEHVYKRACLATPKRNIFITSGDIEILEHMKSIGCNVIESKEQHSNGMERVAEAIQYVNYESIILLQADEILIDPFHLYQLILKLRSNKENLSFNLITKLNSNNQLKDKNVVKCKLSKNNLICNLFRETTDVMGNTKDVYKIMGTMAFPSKSLLEIVNLPKTKNQERLSVEQLKVIENGYSLQGIEVNSSYPSVNLPEDVITVKQFIKNSDRQKQILKSYAVI